MSRKIALLLWCLSVALMAFVILDFWSSRNAPVFKRFERQWAEDLSLLEASGKMPAAWFDTREVEIIGGTPETKRLLKRIRIPISPKKEDGQHRLEVLVVLWEENGKLGVLIQYNLIELEKGNNILELGRTLILNKPDLTTNLRELVNFQF